MYPNLLPIGSIVLLKEGNVRLMICGRIITQGNDTKIYDYVGCIYPQGMTDSKEMYFFNREAIERVYFLGYQDEEELKIQEIFNSLGELEVVDGKIVPKK